MPERSPEELRDALAALRGEVDLLNRELLDVFIRRLGRVRRIRDVKTALGLPLYDPEREAQELRGLLLANPDPRSAQLVERVFQEIFRASLEGMREGEPGVGTRLPREPATVDVGGVAIGGGAPPVVIAGPCAVEGPEALAASARGLAARGIRILRGGGFKPRTSPYSFQGLGLDGVRILHGVARELGMAAVSEITAAEQLPVFEELVDLVQVGSRNMYNYELLKALGRGRLPVLLKRHFGARIEEWLLAAEYLVSAGNPRVILCERGIRTFEPETRNTLDLSAVAVVKERCGLPVVVDVSHAAGRRDILPRLARAALAAGADGLMVEVHHWPAGALSDGGQQLDLPGFDALLAGLRPYLETPREED
ncbi:MAG: bifunctional 3-deoxy-7-phosphoheptulonate synthase/chorismate mutase [Deltaproteobacteria bacterium]|nr:bifunctional 3-deoxy-7-phosphoheptulonate synthase/chorismate mutase [Deltaproteobacteria bacterium]